jgi:excisionase family DNA binding protein
VSSQPDQHEIATLVPSWLTMAEAADQLGVSPNRVRQLARERQLATLRLPGREPGVPAEFLSAGAIVKGLSGTLIVLADHGFDDAEAIEWLFTPDDSLPGRPIDALREDRGKEVRRRAQAII